MTYLFLCQVNTFDSLSYGKPKDTSTASSSRCSRGEPSTLCGSGSDDEISLLMTDSISAVPSPADDSRTTTDKVHTPGLPVSVENHLVPQVSDPLQHRSQRMFVEMPPHRHCQLIQTPIDFRLPVTVIISLSTKVDK